MDDKQTRIKVDTQLANGEKVEVFLNSWIQHIKDKKEVESFTTIVTNPNTGQPQLFQMAPNKDQIFLPFSEFNGDHTDNWVLAVDKKTGEEVFRKNIKNIDLLTWK